MINSCSLRSDKNDPRGYNSLDLKDLEEKIENGIATADEKSNYRENVVQLKIEIKKLLHQLGDEYDNRQLNILTKIVTDYLDANDLLDFIPDIGIYNSISKINRQVFDRERNSETYYQGKDGLEINKNKQSFLDNSFGTLFDIKNKLQQKVTRMLLNTFIIDRENGKLVTDITSANNNVRALKQRLFEQAFGEGVLFEDSQYTGILNELKSEIAKYNNKLNQQDIDELYNKDLDEYLKLESWFILNNFDNFLDLILGEYIKIDAQYKNKLSDGDNYYYSGKSDSSITTWRDTEEQYLETEINKLSQALINTTPFYKYGTETNTGRYLTFDDFFRTITQIKNIHYNELASDFIFDDIKNTLKGVANLIAKYPELEGNSLRWLVNQIRENPLKYLQITMDVLNNVENLMEDLGFTNELQDKCYSLYKGVFDATHKSSIKHILNSYSKSVKQYYQTITQTADSIFETKFVQYYQNEDGRIILRSLRDLDKDNIRRSLESIIYRANSRRSKFNFEQSDMIPYEAQPTRKESGSLDGIEFKLGDYTIKLTNLGEVVTLYKGDTMVGNVPEDSNFLEFIKEQTILDVVNDKLLREEIIHQGLPLDGLFKLASVIYFNKYVSAVELANVKGPKATVAKLLEIYGSSKLKPSFNYLLNEMNLLSNVFLPLLNMVASAQAVLTGAAQSIQVQDSEGNPQSTQSTSRLIGSLPAQLERIITEQGAASKFSFLNKGFFKGYYNTKDLKSPIGNKDCSKFTVAEFVEGNFLYGFVLGFIEDSTKQTLIGNGNIGILPCTNSDKSNFGTAIFDLNKQAPKFNKRWIDLSNSEIEEILRDELLSYYAHVNNRIRNVFLQLSEFSKIVIDYDNNFEQFNSYCQAIGQKPYDFLYELTKDYNNKNRLNPINITEQSFFIKEKGTGFLKRNNTLQASISRFNSKEKFDKFITIKRIDMLSNIFQDNIDLNLDDSSTEYTPKKYLVDEFPEWVSPSNTMVIAKVNINGTSHSIANKQDLELLKQAMNGDLYNLRNYNFQLHPMLVKWANFDYLLSLEYVLSSVGSHINHPSKASFKPIEVHIKPVGEDFVLPEDCSLSERASIYNQIRIIEDPDAEITLFEYLASENYKNDLFTLLKNEIKEEADRFLAQWKRNVSNTATMYSFQRNQIDGTPDEYNIAPVEDIDYNYFTLNGATGKSAPFDGCTFVNPYVIEWENNSLDGNRAGIDKKPFIHYYDIQTGTGGIIKTAGFGVTNNRVRENKFYRIMLYNMTHYEWLNEDGTQHIMEGDGILRDFEGNEIVYDPIFFKKGSKYYYRELVSYEGNNTYKTHLYEVNNDGTVTENLGEELITVNSNYDLHTKLFGGWNSMDINPTTGELEFSETSRISVAKAASYYAIPKSDTIDTAADLWQPLKHSDIHYMPNVGAIKLGIASVNPISVLYNKGNLNFFKIKITQAGIQLDKEHQADNAHLSLMTLVISAAAAMGYTADKAQNLYTALNSLTKIGTKDFRDLLGNITIDSNQFDAAVSKVILDSILNSSITDGNLILTIAKNLIVKMKDRKQFALTKEFAEEVDTAIPYSNRGIYNKFISILTSSLTKAGIKEEMSGVLAVLNPTQDAIKLYKAPQLDNEGNIKRDPEGNILWRKVKYGQLEDYFDIYGVETEEEILNKIDSESKPNLTLADVQVGRFYSITTLEETIDPDGTKVLKPKLTNVYVKFPTAIGQVNKLVNGNNVVELGYSDLKNIENLVNIQEVSKFGQDLQSYNVTFSSVSGDRYSMLDLDILQDFFNLKTLEEELLYNQSIELLKKYGRLESFTNFILKDLGMSWNDDSRRAILNVIVTNIESAYSLIDLLFITPDKLVEFKKYLSITAQKILNRELQFTLEGISPSGKIDKVWINGQLVTVDKNSIKTQAYGCIMPKTFKTDLGLDFDDDLNYIKHNPDFFIEKIARRFTTKVENIQDFDDDGNIVTRYNFHIELKRNNGNHIYVREGEAGSHFAQELLIDKYVDELGKVYWRDGDIVCQLSSIDDKVFVDHEGNKIIVVKPDSTIWKDSKGNVVSVKENKEGFFFNGKQLSDKYTYTDDNGDTQQLTKEDYSGILFYIDNSDYSSVYINKATNTKEFSRILNHLVSSTNPVGSDIGKRIRDYGSKEEGLARIVKKLKELSDSLNDYTSLLKEGKKDDIAEFKHGLLRKLGRRMHTSFLKTLNIIAARIPAQSLQSFMAMEVEGYDNPDINSAYVSSMQFYLQGSDLDVDAVSLQTFTLDHSGLFVGHSPYYKLESEEILKASQLLPFPTGEKLNEDENSSTLVSLLDEIAILEDESVYEVENDFLSKLLGIDVEANIKQAINDSIFKIKFIKNKKSNKVKVYLSLDTADKIKRFSEILKLNTYGTDSGVEVQTEFNNTFGENKATKEQIQSINELIIEIINKHNLYIVNSGVSKRSKIMKNYVTQQLYDLIIDPINQREAQSSVDAVTREAKDIAARSPKASAQNTFSTGNPINKFEGISANMVGKDGIAVCATGLKGFFAITQALNQIIKTNPEIREKLMFNKTIGGKTYRGLANLYDDSKIHPEVRELISNADEYTPLDFQNRFEDFLIDLYLALDAANEGSACLSLSTDNAKELVLDKINAGTATLGMYLYGLFIGVPFETLYKIIASPAGVRLHELTKGDYLNNNTGTFDIIGALDYTKTEPTKELSRFLTVEGYEGTALTEILLEEHRLIDVINDHLDKGTSKEVLYKSLNDKRRAINSYASGIKDINVKKLVISKYNLLVDFVLNFVDDAYLTSWKNSYETIYGTSYAVTDFEKLAMGAVEFKTIGKILKLNQGINTASLDLLRQVSTIENLIVDRKKQLRRYYLRHNDSKSKDIKLSELHREKISLKQLLTNPAAMDTYINKYDEVVDSFNPLYIFKYVPHYRGYGESLMVAYEGALKKSSKFLVTAKLKPLLESQYQITDPSLQDLLGKNLENLVDMYYREEWMKLKYAKQHPVIPASTADNKSYAFIDNTLNAKPVYHNRPILLGTNLGDANFKLWMEQTVIPKFKLLYPNNKFIQDLYPTINPKTSIGAISSAYSLKNVNMMPRTAYDKDVFRTYKNAFNDLKTVRQPYNDAAGNKWNPQELLYLYSLITNNGKISSYSLHSIFEDYLETAIPKSFHEFIAEADSNNSQDIIEYINNNRLDTLPFSSPYRGGSNSFKVFNRETEEIELWEKADTDYEEFNPEESDNTINSYAKTTVFSMINPNYSLSHVLVELDKDVHKEFSEGLSITYKEDGKNLKILDITAKDLEKANKYLEYIINNKGGDLPSIINEDKKRVLNHSQIKEEINNIECLDV